MLSVCLWACERENGGNGQNGEEGLVGGFNSAGASNALFSVAPGKQVRFSKGNLQHHPAFGAWRFADKQYIAQLDTNKNISESFSGWIDLFGWGTSGWDGGALAYQPWTTDKVDTHYWAGGDPTNGLFGETEYADWGVFNNIYGGGNLPKMWRTLKRDEWKFLLDTIGVRAGKWGFAVIADKYYGLVVLPDEWKVPQGVSFNPSDGTQANSPLNSYSVDKWDIMESGGAIFMPVAQVREGTDVYPQYHFNYLHSGLYWSASYRDDSLAYAMVFNYEGLTTSMTNASINIEAWFRHMGLAVRLVQDKQ